MTETLQTLVDEAREAKKHLGSFEYYSDKQGKWIDVCDVMDRLCAALSAPAGEWVMLPKRLTAENGAKAALIGEFAESHWCLDGNGDEVIERVPVSWTTIKEIHKRVVELFAAAPAESATPSAGWAERLYREVHQIAVEFREVCHNTDGKYPTDRDCNRKMHDLLLRLLGEDVKASIAYHITAPSSPVPDASKAQTLITGTKEIALAETGRRADAVLNMKAAANLRERAEAEIAALSKQSDWARTCCAYEASDAALKTLVVIRDLAAALPSTGTGEDAKDAALKKARGVIRAAGSHRLLRDSEREALSGIDAALSSPAKGER